MCTKVLFAAAVTTMITAGAAVPPPVAYTAQPTAKDTANAASDQPAAASSYQNMDKAAKLAIAAADQNATVTMRTTVIGSSMLARAADACDLAASRSQNVGAADSFTKPSLELRLVKHTPESVTRQRTRATQQQEFPSVFKLDAVLAQMHDACGGGLP